MPDDNTGYKFDVFVSYSHQDKGWVRGWLLPRLEKAKLQVCIDFRDFDIGVPGLVNMTRAVDNSRHTIIVLTRAWVKSEWTEFEDILVEMSDAAGRRRRLLPLMLESCQPPRRINMRTHADFKEKETWEAQLKRVINAIRGRLSLVDNADVSKSAHAGARSSVVAAPNPFGITGRIDNPEFFFDREELLRRIFEELDKGTSLSLVGRSQIGKSSLLSMICEFGAERLHPPPERLAYLSLQWVYNEDDFYEALCDVLGVEEPCRGYQLTRALRDHRSVLCLDEIEKMAWDGFSVHIRSHLRGLADGASASLKLVIASRSPLACRFPDSPELDSPLAGICPPIDVGPFSPDIARAFLLDRLKNTGLTFSEEEIETLIESTGGHPGKLQRAAADLYRQYEA